MKFTLTFLFLVSIFCHLLSMEHIEFIDFGGSHSVIWDGDNNDGSPVGTGVYFYQLKTENMKQYRKMLLIK